MALLDQVLKHVADDAPGQVVEWRGGRDGAGAAEDDRGHEVAQEGLGPAAGEQVDDHRSDGPEDEEQEEVGVDLSRGEDARWADEAPYYGGWVGMSKRRLKGGQGDKYRRRRRGRRGR